MIDSTFKLDPSLRELVTGNSQEPVSATVFVNPEIETADEDQLIGLGLVRPATRGNGWTGILTVEALLLIASMPAVSYISNAGTEVGQDRRTTPRYRPPAPSKRGHTMLPPRRE